jgi:hypothetical protein
MSALKKVYRGIFMSALKKVYRGIFMSALETYIAAFSTVP